MDIYELLIIFLVAPLLCPSIDCSVFPRNEVSFKPNESSIDKGLPLMLTGYENEIEDRKQKNSTKNEVALALRNAYLHSSSEERNVYEIKNELSFEKLDELSREKRAAKKPTPKPRKNVAKKKQKVSKTARKKSGNSKSQNKASKKTISKKTPPRTKKKQVQSHASKSRNTASKKKAGNSKSQNTASKKKAGNSKSQYKASKKITPKKTPVTAKKKQVQSNVKKSQNAVSKEKSGNSKAQNVNKAAKSHQKANIKTKPTEKKNLKPIGKPHSLPKETNVAHQYGTTVSSNASESIQHDRENMTFFNTVTANDASLEDGHFHIFHGNFKLNLDINSLGFSDQRYHTMPGRENEKCIFKTWGKSEVNILFIDIQFINPNSVSGNGPEIFKDRQDVPKKENIRYGQQAYRFKRSVEEDLKNIEVRRARIQKISSRMTATRYRTSNASEHHEPLLNHSNAENFTYRMVSEPAEYERLQIFKPPLRKSESKPIWNKERSETIKYKKAKKIGKWVGRKNINKGDTLEGYYRMADTEENPSKNNERKRKFQTHHPTTFDPRANPKIVLKSFSPLIDFVNGYLLKTNGSHMLLLSEKFKTVLSGESNLEDFLFKLIEKSSKSRTITRNSKYKNRNVLRDYGLFKIIFIHFVSTDRSIHKNTLSDILQLKFKISPEIESIASKMSDKKHFIRQVEENCLSIPLKRETSFQMIFSVTTSPRSSRLVLGLTQMNYIIPNSLSKETACDLQGEFVLQVKKTKELPSCSTKNETNNSKFYYRSNNLPKVKNMAPSTNYPTDSAISAISQAADDKTQYQTVEEHEDISENQPTIGFDYWIPESFLQPEKLIRRDELYRPEDLFRNLLSLLFPNISMPPDLLEGIHLKTAPAIHQLSANNNPTLKQKSRLEGVQSRHRKLTSSSPEDFEDNDAFVEPPVDIDYPEPDQQSNKNRFKLLDENNGVLQNDERDEYPDETLTEEGTESVEGESLVNNSKQKSFRGMFQLKPKVTPSNDNEQPGNDVPIQRVTGSNKLTLGRFDFENDRSNTNSSNREYFQGIFKLKTKQSESSNNDLENSQENEYEMPEEDSVSLIPNTPIDPSVVMDEPALEPEKSEPLRGSDDAGDFHGVFQLKTKDETSENEKFSDTEDRHVHNVQNDQYESADEDRSVLLKMCESLTTKPQENFHRQFQLKQRFRKESPFEVGTNVDSIPREENVAEKQEMAGEKSNFHGVFKLKTKQDNEIKNNSPYKLKLNHPENESVLENQNFHGVFKFKTKEEYPGNGGTLDSSPKNKLSLPHRFDGSTVMNRFEGIFQIKSKEEYPGNAGAQDISQLKKNSLLQNSDGNQNLHGVFKFKTKEEHLGNGGTLDSSPKNKLSLPHRFDGSTVMNKFEGMFQIKSKEGYPGNAGAQDISQLRTNSWPQRSDENTVMVRSQGDFHLKLRNEDINSGDNLADLEILRNWCKRRFRNELKRKMEE